uniref:Uncharacterized protein n=1 Tax=Rhizophora mucronata TaxID=61149 RepID=A0A2P2NVP1_RHIMU
MYNMLSNLASLRITCFSHFYVKLASFPL